MTIDKIKVLKVCIKKGVIGLAAKKSSHATVSAALVLTAGAIAAGFWGLPHYIESQQLAHQAQQAEPSIAAITPASVETTGNLDLPALEAALSSLLEQNTNGTVSALAIDSASGTQIFAKDSDSARIPASNLKLLTQYTLLRSSQATARYETKVLTDSETLTLVAGGDSLLGTGESQHDLVVGHAGVRTLAERTLAALKDAGTTGEQVVNLDTSIFEGNDLNPAWAPEDVESGFVGHISPLAFYSHYSPGEQGEPTASRPQDAATQVLSHLVADLNELAGAGELTFRQGTRVVAKDGATQLASVESATVAEQASYMMQESDNMLAETLARNAALAAGNAGSTAGAIETVEATLAGDGIKTQGLELVDLSGLSMDNRVSNETLVELANAMVTNQHDLSSALGSFPVAGGSGTLSQRFDDEAEEAAQGFARAKTGTLNKVIALTGYTTATSGQVITFSIVVNDLDDINSAKSLVDRFTAILSQG